MVDDPLMVFSGQYFAWTDMEGDSEEESVFIACVPPEIVASQSFIHKNAPHSGVGCTEIVIPW